MKASCSAMWQCDVAGSTDVQHSRYMMRLLADTAPAFVIDQGAATALTGRCAHMPVGLACLYSSVQSSFGKSTGRSL